MFLLVHLSVEFRGGSRRENQCSILTDTIYSATSQRHRATFYNVWDTGLNPRMAMATRFAAHLICTTYLLHVSAVQCTTYCQMPDSVVEPGTVQNHNPTSGITLETPAHRFGLPYSIASATQALCPLVTIAKMLTSSSYSNTRPPWSAVAEP
ncbi:hypothetical protein CY34DRAFT_510960 [Suillus luteus UH-Slu-Lm8-n1]|uniref:Uncharacterized protein n=1 Tax=Suillus luteus UH-Slu-Lm8-n1 TaxID=930992 RepID=A0A0D0AXB4_9AGAM|nr:hypothetical protein CY34DRAFT_510960 [Suillus luteus UH-Slu-Lm8-n1]